MIKKIIANMLILVMCILITNVQDVNAEERTITENGMGKIVITHTHQEGCYRICGGTRHYIGGGGAMHGDYGNMKCYSCGSVAWTQQYNTKCGNRLVICGKNNGEMLNTITYPLGITAIEQVDAKLQIGTVQPLTGCQWQIKNGDIWDNLTDNTKYVGTNTETMIIKNSEQSDSGKIYRCIVQYDGNTYETEPAPLKVMKKGYSKIIASYYKQSEAGTEISIENVLVSLMYDNGTADFASGWSNLYFITAQDGVETECKKVPVQFGDNVYKVRLKDENATESSNLTKETTLQVKGIDSIPPEFEEVEISDYEVRNEDDELKQVAVSIKLKAKDQFNTNLTYALKKQGDAVQEADFTAQIQYDLSVTENGIYTAYVKDIGGNITSKDIEIVVSDKEDPVIKSKSLVFKEAEGWVTKNIVQVEATDNYKTEQLQYRFTPPKEITYDLEDKNNTFGVWIPENNVIIQENGIYTIEVKDFVGNITTTTIDVKNVDATAPKITNVEIKTL